MEAAKAQRCQIRPARSEADLEQLEAAYRVLDLYIWLSFRLEDAFTGGFDRIHFACVAVDCKVPSGVWHTASHGNVRSGAAQCYDLRLVI